MDLPAMGTRRVGRAVRALVLCAMLGSGGATASSTTGDMSDLWWNPLESGWGLQLVHQRDTVFATMFVYAASGQPEFYVAVLERGVGLVFSGKAYRSTGPYWGGVFDPAVVVESEVGTMSFRALSVANGRLEYTISGVDVVKEIQRMSFANDHLAPSYVGVAKHEVVSGVCSSIAATPASAQITHAGGSQASGAMTIGGRTCTLAAATYAQQGQFGIVYGPYTCPDGEAGSAILGEIKVAVDTVVIRYEFNGSGPGGACRVLGTFAAVRQ